MGVVSAWPHLERCELWGNTDVGVRVTERGNPTLTACIVRDHAEGRAVGIRVQARSNAAVGADCVFRRNDGGSVVRA